MAAPAPAIRSAFQLTEKGKEKGEGIYPSLKGMPCKFYGSCPLISLWPELNYLVMFARKTEKCSF